MAVNHFLHHSITPFNPQSLCGYSFNNIHISKLFRHILLIPVCRSIFANFNITLYLFSIMLGMLHMRLP